MAFSCAQVANAAGASDPAFGNGGKVFVNFFADKLAIDPAGNVLVAGTQCASDNDCQMAVTKLDATGVPVASFGVNGQTLVRFGTNLINSGNAIAIDAGGNVYVGGTTQQDAVAGDADFALIKLDASGSLVQGFGNGGKQTIGFGAGIHDVADDLTLDPGGNVWLAGSTLQGLYEFAVAKVAPSGSVATTQTVRFDDLGQRGHDIANTVITDASGNGYIAGTELGASYVPWRFCELAKLDAGGTLVPSFGIGGKRIVIFGLGGGGCTAMARDPGGNVVIVGSVAAVGGGQDIVVTKLDSNGHPVTAFGVNGFRTIDIGGSTDDNARAVLIDGSGNIFVIGNTSTGFVPGFPFGHLTYSMVVVKLDARGNLSNDFGNGGKRLVIVNSNTGEISRDGALDGRGGIYIVGQTAQANVTQSVIVKLSDAALDAPSAIPVLHPWAIFALGTALFALGGSTMQRKQRRRGPAPAVTNDENTHKDRLGL